MGIEGFKDSREMLKSYKKSRLKSLNPFDNEIDKIFLV